MEERKFVCKYCSKRFPCGKSLGGHIRTHMMSEHSAQANEASAERRSNAAMLKLDAAERKRKRESGYGGGGGGGGDDGGGGGGGGAGGNLMYGLRENPKKTTRFVHSNATSSQMEKFCKECGKGFPSLKALCGHMACHSEKDRGTNLSEKQKLVMDTQSDTETSGPTHPRRSKRMRFNFNNNNNNNNNLTNHHPSSSLANGSSSVSEVEQEQEEVARCLMMLSKDSSYKGRFALVTDSSDNNSVVLEAKSPSVTFNFGKNFVSNAYELVEQKKKVHKDTKLKSSAEIGYDSDNSDSGYFRYGPKKVDSDEESSDGFFRNEVKSSKVGYLSGFDGYDVESRKMMMLSRGSKKLVLEDLDNEHSKFGSRKRLTYDSVGQKTEALDHGGGKGWKKNHGLFTNERDNNGSGSEDSAYESDENSTDSDSYPATKPHKNLNVKKCNSSKGKKKLKSKKSKEHECPICNKIFRSGQALGGHKRSHFVGGSEENTLVIRPGAAAAPAPAAVAVPCLIDLNLPAPVDE
ncbi:uncharacterized protein LOC130739756 [Lotus japonicus]|uniref:uncharacterized protein LOC130739756 n=1 Tax=Lotus japonicus TaxID=34305 RepID=UPI002583FE9A|nr:uncharacterized protein LOC130739756 [Lotus japonicus]